jgi:anti-anti-sigma factor
MDVDIRKDDEKEEVEVYLSGKLDARGAAELQKALDDILEGDAGIKLIIDFAFVPFVSSAGLRIILLTLKKLRATGGSLELTKLNDSVKDVFNMTGFSSILKIV